MKCRLFSKSFLECFISSYSTIDEINQKGLTEKYRKLLAELQIIVPEYCEFRKTHQKIIDVYINGVI